MQLKINGHTTYIATGNRSPDPKKETVLFIHGTGQDHSIWVLPTRYFARHGRNVLAVDLPGHGRSKGTPLKTIEEMAGPSRCSTQQVFQRPPSWGTAWVR